MTRRAMAFVVLVIVAAMIAAAAGAWFSSWGGAPAGAPSQAELQALAPGSTWDQAGANGSGLPGTASKIDIRAWFPGPVSSAGTRALNVRLHIADGWHVNANPAALDFLIPTTVQATADGRPIALETTYPPGVRSDVRLGKTLITVYEDNTTIRSELPAAAVAAVDAAGGLQVNVRAQACNDKGVCLPPSMVETHVPAGG